MADLPAETGQYVATIAPHEFIHIARTSAKRSRLQLLGDRVKGLLPGLTAAPRRLWEYARSESSGDLLADTGTLGVR